eukprot:CAMPEP_0201660224 /NCGR_PEP_ID=MMETSP0494-20130426/2898_1 /ASSEMBLY_ACC=CAM_ASM_000839 /TAXON_ID=420259 /ORGANISM="Thalassiosira gravida, Strain GMp14c1" /LENGTH=140 /DNA_ID=CAMNT_0048138009 /DNA_START=53 /DNA_END=475 /DNA_ORIENTATION=+
MVDTAADTVATTMAMAVDTADTAANTTDLAPMIPTPIPPVNGYTIRLPAAAHLPVATVARAASLASAMAARAVDVASLAEDVAAARLLHTVTTATTTMVATMVDTLVAMVGNGAVEADGEDPAEWHVGWGPSSSDYITWF